MADALPTSLSSMGGAGHSTATSITAFPSPAAAASSNSAALVAAGRVEQMEVRRPEWRPLLLAGATFTKFGRMGTPHPRVVWVTPDLSLIQWRKVGTKPAPMGKDAMRVEDILSIEEGTAATPVFQRNAKYVTKPACCFSVVCGGPKARSLDLECDSVETKETWMLAFMGLKAHRGEL